MHVLDMLLQVCTKAAELPAASQTQMTAANLDHQAVVITTVITTMLAVICSSLQLKETIFVNRKGAFKNQWFSTMTA